MKPSLFHSPVIGISSDWLVLVPSAILRVCFSHSFTSTAAVYQHPSLTSTARALPINVVTAACCGMQVVKPFTRAHSVTVSHPAADTAKPGDICTLLLLAFRMKVLDLCKTTDVALPAVQSRTISMSHWDLRGAHATWCVRGGVGVGERWGGGITACCLLPST